MSKEYLIRILKIEDLTHDVKRFTMERPRGFDFIPGQAVELRTAKSDVWDREPFTITTLRKSYELEFIIKIYKEREKLTNELARAKEGDSILISEPFGTIQYKGDGVFIAAGTGITPFISIMRDLKSRNLLGGNKLIYSNKTQGDIIQEKELSDLFRRENSFFTLTREKKGGYLNGRINKEMISKIVKNFKQKFYVCGPDSFVNDIRKILKEFGVKDAQMIYEE